MEIARKALASLLPQGLLFQEGGVPGMSGAHLPSTAMMVYAGVYAVLLVALGARTFTRRDL